MATSKYNLEQLGWFNFEKLVRTLLVELVGPGLSVFNGSVDQGRDATFNGVAKSYPSKEGTWSGSWIFQVKHRMYSSQGAAMTRRALKRDLPAELGKIVEKHEHDCDNYVFISNCPLTSADKDEMLAQVRDPKWDITNCAVIGESDLDTLLDANPRVVSAFPQILGISQLRELVAWGLHQRSIQFLQAAQVEIATFVATSAYLRAIDLLHKQHFCVLSGPPKMGKTCTAYALAASFSAQKFEIWELRNQRDFHDTYEANAKQLFICDDVFGAVDMRSSQRDDWSQGFLRLLGSLDKDHKLIWTAREYILQEALASSKLKEERPNLASIDKVTVSVDELTRLEKAMILYNHAKEAYLPENVKTYLRTEASLSIVDHENFSPESVRQLCTGRLVEFASVCGDEGDAISSKVGDFLSRPGDTWKTAYLSAPSGEKLLCIEVMASGGFISVSDLQIRYEKAVSSSNGEAASFEKSLTNALGTFLRKRPYRRNEELVHFYHPSMRDLLTELIEQDAQIRVAYLKQLTLAEFAVLLTPIRIEHNTNESSEHRIRISNPDEVDLLRDHLRTTLLPRSSIDDLLTLTTELIAAIGNRSDNLGKSFRSKHSDALLVWMILDSIVRHACSSEFWTENADHESHMDWEKLFENLRVLLPVSNAPLMPEYIPQLLRRTKSVTSVHYWGMIATVHKIVPTIVEQCVELESREECRTQLEESVEEALNESERLNLESDYNDSQSWHDEYGDLADECNKYELSFPNDTDIERSEDLWDVTNNFPRIEYEPDYNEDDRFYSSSLTTERNEILRVFSDL